eukprot:scaffold6898_cov128-Skeletonema_menzelii.AAC.4
MSLLIFFCFCCHPTPNIVVMRTNRVIILPSPAVILVVPVLLVLARHDNLLLSCSTKHNIILQDVRTCLETQKGKKKKEPSRSGETK